MSHYVMARKRQTSQHPTYLAHECESNPFYCLSTIPCRVRDGVRDLAVDTISCGIFGECPQQNVCLQPDVLECTIGRDSKGNDPLLAIQWDERAPNLKCTYNLDYIDRVDQLNVYMDKFDEQHKNTLYSAFCGKRVDSPCPSKLAGGCSRFLALDETGNACRRWMSTLPRDTQDAVMRDYCLRNDTIDCKCINRTSDPDYERVKDLNNYFTDNCWYKPCANSENVYLVPNRLSENACATNVCQQIIDAHAKGQIEITGNTNNINCNFGGGPQPIPPNPTPHAPEPPDQPHFKRWLRENWIIPALVVVLIAFLLVSMNG